MLLKIIEMQMTIKTSVFLIKNIKLEILILQRFDIKPFIRNKSNIWCVHKRKFCINLVLYLQNMTCPQRLDPFYYSRTAGNFQACPKLRYSTLCSCLHKGVFLQFSDIFWKIGKQTNWEEWKHWTKISKYLFQKYTR